MTNDLGTFLLDALYLFGGIVTMLFLLAVVDPQTGRTELARPRSRRVVQGQMGGRPATPRHDRRGDRVGGWVRPHRLGQPAIGRLTGVAHDAKRPARGTC